MAMSRLILISGPVGSGKTTLSAALESKYGALHLRTRELMATRAQKDGSSLPKDRAGLQAYGETLDRLTGGRWVADDLASLFHTIEPGRLVVIDSIRIREQLDAVREAFGRDVVHLHLSAPREELSLRYKNRGQSSGIVELASYDEVFTNPTEAAVVLLAGDADIAIDSQRCSPADVVTRCAAGLGLLVSPSSQLVM